MITRAVTDEMIIAKRRYDEAVLRGIGANLEKERMKNLAYNYYEDILAMCEECQALTAENEQLRQKVDVYEKMMAEANTKTRKKNESEKE